MNSKHITNYKPKDFAELLGVSVKTLQRWDRENILKAKRTPTDRRYYTYEQYLEFKGINGSDNDRKTVIYTRVSTNGQKDVENIPQKNTNQGIGIDLGIKDFAICSDKIIYKNINKTQRVKKLEKKLLREQKRLSRKYESLKIRNKKDKGEATRQNIQKQIAKVQILYQRLNNIRTDYINKVVSNVVRNKPSYITIEDLNVKGMMRNKHLSKAVAQQKFNEFRNKLATKCNALGIELRIVDRFYPSSKLCHKCGSIKKDLKLKDRIFNCDCGYVEDRDYNASLNLRDAKIYKIA